LLVTVKIEGVNLEKLLSAASEAGVVLLRVQRYAPRVMRMQVRAGDWKTLEALCDRYGWACETVRLSSAIRLVRFLRRRFMLMPALFLGILMVGITSQMILCVRIEHAQQNTAQVSSFLKQKGVRPGRLKASVSLDALEAELAFAMPGLAFSGLRYAGSTLICDCRPAVEGEQLAIAGDGEDIVALQAGIVKRIWVSSGTPQVVPGQAVHRGQVLISGVERTQKGGLRSVKAEGQVTARVFAGGEARASLKQTRVVETGRQRTRITVRTPWHSKVIREAVPFASQAADRTIQRVSSLYLPLWREVDTFAETEVFVEQRDRGDAASMAQGAAERIAKEQCPVGALILDKWVNYSMIDNEFVYASVVLEYEAPIAGRVQ